VRGGRSILALEASTMNKFLYFAGFAYIALCGAIVVRELRAPSGAGPGLVAVPAPDPAPPSGSSGEQWFASIKQYCNPVEVDVRTRFAPPPSSVEGAGYAAACFALAGKIERARAMITSAGSRDRFAAANIVFNVAHPVADAGDDRASGQMMELVLEFWPNNFMARYHAGMSAYALGQHDLAQRHLRSFLDMYNAADGFTQNAREALKNIESRAEQSTGRPRPRVERDSSARP
jgi:hypothetical protein